MFFLYNVTIHSGVKRNSSLLCKSRHIYHCQTELSWLGKPWGFSPPSTGPPVLAFPVILTMFLFDQPAMRPYSRLPVPCTCPFRRSPARFSSLLYLTHYFSYYSVSILDLPVHIFYLLTCRNSSVNVFG